MLFPEKDIILKDGRKARLMSPDPMYARDMIEFLKTVAVETDYLVRTADEFKAMTEESEASFLSKVNSSANTVMIICLVEGEFAGNCTLQINVRAKIRHRASIGIALYKKFWNIGIGGAMIDELIGIAGEKGVKQVELHVMEGNDRAMALYRKKGFSEVAVLPDAYRRADGAFCSQITMIRTIG